jgi:CRISPR/Cas system-associated endoribonuclease Cas2
MSAMRITTGIVAIAVLAGTVPATAKTIEQRKKHQEQRIEKGEKSGKLSPEEAQKIRQREDQINKEEADMKALHKNGKLTAHERQVIHNQQRKTSHEIRHEKHDQNAQ